MKKTIISLIAILAFSLNMNAQQVHEQDPADHQARVFPMPVEHLYFHSEILDFDKNFTVYLPDSYSTDSLRKYPVVYMLHGANENDWEWANIPTFMINAKLRQSRADGMAAEVIMVCPNATEGTMGYFNREGWKYEDYFFQELMPFIESHYRIIADKGHRAIGGLSMGGGGSFMYGLTHPELFSSVYAISGAVPSSLNSEDKGNTPFSRQFNLGDLTEAQIAEIKTVNFVLDCGDDDFLFDANVACYQSMKKAELTCEFRSRNGGHASYYWYDGLGDALLWFTRHFSEQCK
ncbi:alpha/beta hydrolase-fold protein [uncultured Draconibacterium sp.]|uniref:alpha/beta hydrolase n=1 Tax=uncultured Draconibacterium sp. TaxID=1573823 RepID=UPI002AA6EE1D|nr:alpha/beta hydrolase-fold protein [uncultured Draconibacterium sp.]